MLRDSDRNLARRASINTAGALTTSSAAFLTEPGKIAASVAGFAVVWALTESFIGNAIALRQQKATEWVEMIRAKPSIFTTELFDDEEFQDAFVVALEDYLKLRSILKRQAAKRIFIDYAKSADKARFKLETHNNVISDISVDALELLSLIDKQFLPKQLQDAKGEMKVLESQPDDKSQLILAALIRRNPLSKYHEAFLDEQYGKDKFEMVPDRKNPAKPNLSSSTGIHLMNENRRDAEEVVVELSTLGLVRIRTGVSGGGWDNMPRSVMSWDLTSYGKEFLKYLKDEKDQ